MDADVDRRRAPRVATGLYENQDPDQADWNLLGRFLTDDAGTCRFRSIKPSGYPIPMGGPVGDLLTTLPTSPPRLPT